MTIIHRGTIPFESWDVENVSKTQLIPMNLTITFGEDASVRVRSNRIFFPGFIANIIELTSIDVWAGGLEGAEEVIQRLMRKAHALRWEGIRANEFVTMGYPLLLDKLKFDPEQNGERRFMWWGDAPNFNRKISGT